MFRLLFNIFVLAIVATSAAFAQLSITGNDIDSKRFPYDNIYVSVAVTGATGLTSDNFTIYEDGVLQTDRFEVSYDEAMDLYCLTYRSMNPIRDDVQRTVTVTVNTYEEDGTLDETANCMFNYRGDDWPDFLGFEEYTWYYLNMATITQYDIDQQYFIDVFYGIDDANGVDVQLNVPMDGLGWDSEPAIDLGGGYYDWYFDWYVTDLDGNIAYPSIQFYVEATGNNGETVTFPYDNPENFPLTIALESNYRPQCFIYSIDGVEAPENGVWPYDPFETWYAYSERNVDIPIVVEASDITPEAPEVYLYYRNSGEREYQEVLMVMTDQGDNPDEFIFNGTIPAAYKNCKGIEWFVAARDDYGAITYNGNSMNPHVMTMRADNYDPDNPDPDNPFGLTFQYWDYDASAWVTFDNMTETPEFLTFQNAKLRVVGGPSYYAATERLWTFDDCGNTMEGAEVYYEYILAGTYNLTFYVEYYNFATASYEDYTYPVNLELSDNPTAELRLRLVNDEDNYYDATVETCPGDDIVLGSFHCDDPSQLSTTALAGTPPYTYQWLPATDLDDNTIANPTVINPQFSRVYTLIVTDSEGAQKTAVCTLDVKPQPYISMPQRVVYPFATAVNGINVSSFFDGDYYGVFPEGDTYEYRWADINGTSISNPEWLAEAGNDGFQVTPRRIARYCLTVRGIHEYQYGNDLECYSPERCITVYVRARKDADLLAGAMGDSFIDIYPNPTTDFVNIDAASVEDMDMEIRMYDVMGRQVFHTTTNGEVFFDQIDMTNLPAGMYMLQFRIGDDVFSERIIKQ